MDQSFSDSVLLSFGLNSLSGLPVQKIIIKSDKVSADFFCDPCELLLNKHTAEKKKKRYRSCCNDLKLGETHTRHNGNNEEILLQIKTNQ